MHNLIFVPNVYADGNNNHYFETIAINSCLMKETKSFDMHSRQVMAMNRRRHPRVNLTGMVADVSDGKGFFTGTVHDISRFGLALNDIPEKINSQAQRLTVIVEGHGGHFKLKIAPRWETIAGRQKIIGGQIEQSSLAWTNFVMDFEPKDNDMWRNS